MISVNCDLYYETAIYVYGNAILKKLKDYSSELLLILFACSTHRK